MKLRKSNKQYPEEQEEEEKLKIINFLKKKRNIFYKQKNKPSAKEKTNKSLNFPIITDNKITNA